MTRSVELSTSAPGKLYLFGEYAVLAGAWSMVAAVDRRVTARRYDDDAAYRARGLPEDDLEFVRAVLEAVESETGRSFEPGRFETDVREMYDDGTKLGLGSSAASSVALAAAATGDSEEEIDERAFRKRVLSVAEQAHASFQDGIGSGGGIVSAALGGVLACRRRTPTSDFAALDRGLEVEEPDTTERFAFSDVALPSGLEIRPVWLGQPASTADFVGRVLRRIQLHPAVVYRRLRRLSRIAEDAIRAGRDDDCEAFLACVRKADEAMDRLGETCEIPVVVDAHRELRERAERFRVAVKPSGAGGGDFSLAFGTPETDWEGFRRALPELLRPVELTFGAPGVRGGE